MFFRNSPFFFKGNRWVPLGHCHSKCMTLLHHHWDFFFFLYWILMLTGFFLRKLETTLAEKNLRIDKCKIMSSLGQLLQTSPPEAWQGVTWQSSTEFVEAGTVCHPAVMRFASLCVTHQNLSPYCLVPCVVPFLWKQFRMEQESLWVQTSCFLWRIIHTHRLTPLKAHRPCICLCRVS